MSLLGDIAPVLAEDVTWEVTPLRFVGLDELVEWIAQQQRLVTAKPEHPFCGVRAWCPDCAARRMSGLGFYADRSETTGPGEEKLQEEP